MAIPVFFAFSIAMLIALWPSSYPIPSLPSITAETGVSKTISGLASILISPFSIPLW